MKKEYFDEVKTGYPQPKDESKEVKEGLKRDVKNGDTVVFYEYDGKHTKRIEKILWRPNNKGYEYYEKDVSLPAALDWCILLFDDGTWIDGNEKIATQIL